MKHGTKMSNEYYSSEKRNMAVTENQLRRRTDEIDYWRKRAGWFDDDVSMREFNNGVYDVYYQLDDDQVLNGGGGKSGFSGDGKGLATILKVAAVFVAIAIFVLVYRAISRRLSSSNSKKKKHSSSKSSKGRSDSKSRSGRNSSSRSRAGRSSSSRSRSGRSRAHKSSSNSNYDLMDDKTDTQSRKSSRSKSRSRRSRSRSRAGSRSRSKSKARHSEKEVVLV